MSALTIRRDVLIVACAVSAGVHAALTPEHFGESAGAGGGFLAATILAGALAVVLTRMPESTAAIAAAALVLAGLIFSYVLAVTTGVPVLHPEVEAVDGLALATKAFEAVGIVVALELLRDGRTAAVAQPRGVTA